MQVPCPSGSQGEAPCASPCSHGKRNRHPRAAWEEITSLQGRKRWYKGTSLKKGFGVIGCQESKTCLFDVPSYTSMAAGTSRDVGKQAGRDLRRQQSFESPVQFPSASSRGEQAVTGRVCNRQSSIYSRTCLTAPGTSTGCGDGF